MEREDGQNESKVRGKNYSQTSDHSNLSSSLAYSMLSIS